MRAALVKAVEDVGQSDTPSVSPGPILTGTRPEEEAEALLMELVAAADWVSALKQARRCRFVQVNLSESFVICSKASVGNYFNC